MTDRRTFRLAESSKSGGAAILDVPTVAFFRRTTVAQAKEDFKARWGMPLSAIVIPVIEEDGLLFSVDGLVDAPVSPSAEISPQYQGFQDLVEAILGEGVDLYLSIVPSLAMLNIRPLKIVDVLGTPSSPLCVGQELTQDLVAAILGTAVDIALSAGEKKHGRLRGVAIDVTDLWPAGGSPGRLEATCFCDSCIEYLETITPGLVKRFRTFPNPLSLLMKPTKTGISVVDAFDSTSDSSELVGLSRQHGFDQQFPGASDTDLLTEADALLRYCNARHDQTLAAVDAIFAQVTAGIDNAPDRVIITEGCKYSWTSGLFFDRLDRARSNNVAYDEVWYDPRSGAGGFNRCRYRAYLAARSRYFISDFFQLCGSATDPVSRSISGVGSFSIPELRILLKNRAGKMLGTIGGPQALVALPKDLADLDHGDNVGRTGFVTPALSREFVDAYVEQLQIPPSNADRQAPQRVASPGDLLRLLSPDKDRGENED